MFDLRRDMFVMRLRTGQLRNVGVRPVIVPVQLLLTPIDFVAVSLKKAAIKVKDLPNSQIDVSLEKDLASDHCCQRIETDKNQGAISYGGKFVGNVIDERFVLFQGRGHLFPHGSALASGSTNLLSAAATLVASLKRCVFNRA